MRQLLTTILFLLAAAMSANTQAAVVSDYSTYATKAQRFFDNREWASAAAMYQLMVSMRPEVKSTYPRAIVVEGIRHKHDSQMEFFDAALRQNIPFDSLLSQVRELSFACGQSELYEQFLHTLSSTHRWMERVVDGYLLNYYSFRCNGPQIVAYSRKMLVGLPDDVRYLGMMARGYLLQGDMKSAMNVYRHIIDISPDNFDALLYLGNYYADTATNIPEAIKYLRKAYEVRPTPYVQARLAKLTT